MISSTFTHHFERGLVLFTSLPCAFAVLGGSAIAHETMGSDAALIFLLTGATWLLLGTIGLLALRKWATRRASVYALYAAWAGLAGISTLAVTLFAPIFLMPGIGYMAGLVLLEYFVVALGYQLWSTWRHFNEQWNKHHAAALARCFDPGRAMVAVKPLVRGLYLHETLFLPDWHETAVAIVSLLLGVALLLGFALYETYFEFALVAGGIASLSIITYFIQRTLVPVLLALKLRQLERSQGCAIGHMDDAGIERLRAAERRAKRGNKRK
ncbi:hypothetical protein [Pseudoduganella albidiflava]|nr:hypothetical protein [Pseudoduganella albidiflava]QBI04606.1 hypothetical protein EYF70_30110 [Pseudoduganella albidiflava]